jgi:hypothetical protein
VEHLHKKFLGTLAKILDDNPERAETLNVRKIIEESTPEAVQAIKKSILDTTQSMLEERRSSWDEFRQRNIKRWGKAFDLLETQIVICTEAGEEFNSSYRKIAVEENDIVFDLIVRHHARACQISQEILCLLKSGYADAAHARWRALHEVNVTARFIGKHGRDCAERFYFHEVVDSYSAMREHKKYEDRLQEKGPSEEEIKACKVQYDNLIKRFGKKYGDHYGWASYLFPTHRRVGFAALEKDVELDHMRPYYSWASQNIHSGSKGMRNRLGLCETGKDILLVGQSDAGVIDPGHAAALSLGQITSTLLMMKPTFDSIVLMELINEFQRDIGETFMELSRCKNS